MNKIKVGLIRVVSSTNEDFVNTHGRILMELFPNLVIESRCIPNQPEGIHDDETERMAVPKIVSLAKEFEESGVDLVFVSCAADPGVLECRKSLKIPVIGAGSSCAALSLSLGSRIGVLGITEKAPDIMENLLKDRLVMNIKPEGVNTTLDLYNEEGYSNAMAAVQALKDKGCDTIALGCTGLTTIKIHKDIMERFNMRAIDPVIASGVIMSYMNL